MTGSSVASHERCCVFVQATTPTTSVAPASVSRATGSRTERVIAPDHRHGNGSAQSVADIGDRTSGSDPDVRSGRGDAQERLGAALVAQRLALRFGAVVGL